MEKAVDLVRVAMQQAATDPETGLIDMDAILIGKTAKSRENGQNKNYDRKYHQSQYCDIQKILKHLKFNAINLEKLE